MLFLTKPPSCTLHIHKFKYYSIQGIFFFGSQVFTYFLWNSTSVANKPKANIELSSLCPLHLPRILSVSRDPRESEIERKKWHNNDSTRSESQWFLKVAMNKNPPYVDKKKWVLSGCLQLFKRVCCISTEYSLDTLHCQLSKFFRFYCRPDTVPFPIEAKIHGHF